MIYLSGSSGPALRCIAKQHNIGILMTPRVGYSVAQLPYFPTWAADNSCFTGEFDPDRWLTWLDRHPRTALFATLPDVVGDAVATLQRSTPYLEVVRRMGFAVGYVSQDGATSSLIPWPEIDCLFTGGTDDWKFSPTATKLAWSAQRKGKWTHAGRINSMGRIRMASMVGYDSADGTFLKHGPDVLMRRLKGWADVCMAEPPKTRHWIFKGIRYVR